ncbi:MAG: hypothetical protein DHS20C17_34700 [Cyclobacteriaceae bacterium]|nr:MAG: hypothetical protein DHS20C17_34700 [Cyclobacteriaceae bacterium]
MINSIKITIGNEVLYGALYETPTALAITEALPVETSVHVWGGEIYFEISAQAVLESDAQAEVAVGDLAYWPTMPTFCIFFGPTPASHDGTPVAASAVNVFGRLEEVDLEQLRSVRDGETIRVETN